MNTRLHWSAVWGLLGIQLPILHAIWRLFPRAFEALSMPLDWVHLTTLIVTLGFMGFVEGYKGFQKSFAPRAAARAFHLQSRSLGLQLLAPAFCMALCVARPKRLVINWLLTIFIVGLIVGVTAMPQPWRGIIDAGVILGLSWGSVAMGVMTLRAARGTLDVDLEL